MTAPIDVSQPGALSLFAYDELDGGTFAPHQASGIAWLYDHPRSMLNDDVGLGKTVQIIGLIALLKQLGELGKCLIVMPANLIPQWRQEMARWAPSIVVHDTSEARIAKPTKKSKAEYEAEFPDGPEVLLTSYDFAHARRWRMEESGFTTVFMDEANSVKGGGKVQESLASICSLASRAHAVTASPYENAATETYELLATIGAPGLWSREHFRRRFVVWSESWVDGYGRTVAPKPLGLVESEKPALRAYLKDVHLRRTAEQVGLPLPVRVGVRLMWVPLLPEQQAALDAAERRWKPSMKLQHAREAAVTIAGGRSAKAEAAAAYIDDHPDERKIVVYAFHLDHLDLMAGLLHGRGIGFVQLDGEMKDDERTEALARFRDDPKCRVLLGSDVIGVGLNLQHARMLLSLGSSYNPGKEDQREGRIRRIGSPHASYEHVTFLTQTAHEENKARTIYRKSRDAEAVFGQQHATPVGAVA